MLKCVLLATCTLQGLNLSHLDCNSQCLSYKSGNHKAIRSQILPVVPSLVF